MIGVATPAPSPDPGVGSAIGGGGLARLDPRAQLIVALLLGVSILVAPWPVGAVLAILLAGTLRWQAARSGRAWRGVARLALGGFVVGGVVNLLLVREGPTLLQLPLGVTVTAGGVASGLRIGFRLANLTLLSGLVGLATHPGQQAEALGALLGRLDRVFGRGVHALIFELQLVIRFVPLLREEGERVLTSQRLRGLRIHGGPLPRARQLVPLFIPVLSSTLIRAQHLGLLLAARGYRSGTPRRYLRSARWRRRDTIAVLLIGLLLVGLVVGGI